MTEREGSVVAVAVQCVEQEEELPGDMPDELWDAIKNDRDACVKSHQIAVRKTKENIIARIRSRTPASIQRLCAAKEKVIEAAKEAVRQHGQCGWDCSWCDVQDALSELEAAKKEGK